MAFPFQKVLRPLWLQHKRASFAQISSSASDFTKGLVVGGTYTVERRFTAEDVSLYAKLCGDTNPIHTSKEAAKAANFEDCIVHGMLYAGLFPAIIGNRQPGAIYLTQTLRFRNTVSVGERILAQVQVERISGRRAVLTTTCSKNDPKSGGKDRIIVLEGSALALLPRSQA
ncbi:hypothetical protein CYMTET_16384 [Cymbomonas tetramitiformis]|uniref:MaoC-like domain-containing protein n=1 Tax=Cymbomonas tetramitiformis TaxID=36881 RepID=A0AAE0GCN0_9CHLO|nr:hypothetical protein CYMTET_16384 [Cymbomonas tetramitiformis]